MTANRNLFWPEVLLRSVSSNAEASFPEGRFWTSDARSPTRRAIDIDSGGVLGRC
jgi:hypothetical protein